MKRTIEMPILHREIAEFLDPRIHEAAPGTPSFEEGSPFEIIPIAEGILLIPYNPIETFGNRVDALLSDVKETENFRGLPDEARDAIKTKLQELVDVMQTYHVRSVEKGGDE